MIKEFIKRYKLAVIVFLASTLFFIWQHSSGISWDFTSYRLNAEYLFYHGSYFEWYRPPLMPIILGIFGFLGWFAAEYIFIILVSVFYFFASYFFSKKFKMDFEIFYTISFTPFLLLNSFSVGTELLSLSCILAALAFCTSHLAGMFLGLAFLSRYNNLAFIPIALLSMNIKKIFLAGMLFILIVSPWFIYSYVMTGNPIASIADGYASQIKYRTYYSDPASFYDFLVALSILLPFFVLGLFFRIREIKVNKKIIFKDMIIIIFALFMVYSYIKVPLHIPRYLFNLIIPIAYFSYFSFKRINKKWLIILVIASFGAIFLGAHYLGSSPTLDSKEPYRSALSDVKSDINPNCSLMSNGWVLLNYFDELTFGPAPNKWLLDKRIDNGAKLPLFKHINEPDYTFDSNFTDKYMLKETDKYILLGKNVSCDSAERLDKTYLEQVEEVYAELGENITITNYEIFFTDQVR